MIEHVLNMSDLVGNPESVSEPDRGLVELVLEALNAIDQCARDRMDAVVVRHTPGATATVRALLAPHWRNRTNGYCAGCPEEVQPVWPCPAWRAAHRWLVELDPSTGNRQEDEWFFMPSS